MATFGNRLRFIRKNKGFTLDELAEKLDTTKATLSRYENDKRFPDIHVVNNIANVLNIDINYLLGNSDIRNPYNEDKHTSKSTYTVPEEFTDTDQAREYINKHQIFGSQGFDADKLDDEEIIEFANELLEQMKMVSYKYKK